MKYIFEPYGHLSLTEIQRQWLSASIHAKHYRKALTLYPESDQYAMSFAQWDVEEKMLYAEIERRADLLPMPLVFDLIDSCLPFQFNA
jgi:hypothetical protein